MIGVYKIVAIIVMFLTYIQLRTDLRITSYQNSTMIFKWALSLLSTLITLYYLSPQTPILSCNYTCPLLQWENRGTRKELFILIPNLENIRISIFYFLQSQGWWVLVLSKDHSLQLCSTPPCLLRISLYYLSLKSSTFFFL